MTLQEGTYRIEKVLGQGSFGITYLATARLTAQGNLGTMTVEKKVAVKEFFMSEVNSRRSDGSSVDGSSGNVFTNYRKKFRKEAENLSRLEHPNIVKVFDVFDANNTTYYVMEFLEGTNLDDYIRLNGALPEEEALKVVREIGKAISYMHSRKMLHLDIKPKNIMRRPDGTDHLIDFGLSKQFTEGGEPESSTTIGLGTPGYAPVEQSGYRNEGGFPATLDVYALGATMFKMLTGQRPPEATVILNEEFPMHELEAAGVSEQTATALVRAMAPKKKNRYQTVAAFVEALGQPEEPTIIAKPVKTAPEPEPKPQPKPKPKPEPKPEPKPAPEPEPTPIPEPERPWKKWIGYAAGAAVIIVAVAIYLLTSSGKEQTPAPEDNTVSNMEWVSPLGKSSYSGPVATVGGKKVPDGVGQVKITEGKFAGCSYEGEFAKGVLEGQATYTLSNGDQFIGTFRDNQFDLGEYHVKETGEYYKGSFSNMEPAKGTWYSADGKKIEEI